MPIRAAFELSAPNVAAIPSADLPEIAIAGRSNVGKSSLINTAAMNARLAKTSNTPGKTQALNFYKFEGIRIVDLPGYGFARAPEAAKEAWSQLIDRYLTTRETLAGLLIVVDARHPAFPNDRRMVDWVVARRLPFLVVATKADKLGRGALAASLAALARDLDVERGPSREVAETKGTRGRGRDARIIAFSSVERTGRHELLTFLKGFEP